MVTQDSIVHDVWTNNFDTEFSSLRRVTKEATCVVPAIEFPGLCMTPMGTFFGREQFTYQQLIVNVNALKPIQFGFTLIDETPNGDPTILAIYQFNLHFDLNEDMFTEEAIQAYQEAGIDFRKHSVSFLIVLLTLVI